jgi:hypothetical protein
MDCKTFYLEDEWTAENMSKTMSNASDHSLLFSLLFFIRDIHFGCGEREITYMMIYEWYRRSPHLAMFALQCIIDNRAHIGSWRDFRGMCEYVCVRDGKFSPIIEFLIEQATAQLYRDSKVGGYSVVAKWIPRENSRHSWLFYMMVDKWIASYALHWKRVPVGECYKKYRKMLVKLSSSEKKVNEKGLGGFPRITSVTQDGWNSFCECFPTIIYFPALDIGVCDDAGAVSIACLLCEKSVWGRNLWLVSGDHFVHLLKFEAKDDLSSMKAKIKYIADRCLRVNNCCNQCPLVASFTIVITNRVGHRFDKKRTIFWLFGGGADDEEAVCFRGLCPAVLFHLHPFPQSSMSLLSSMLVRYPSLSTVQTMTL